MNDISETLALLDEPFASGYYEMPDAPPVIRWSRAVRRELESRYLPLYEGSLLFPVGFSAMGDPNSNGRILVPNLVQTWHFNPTALESKLVKANESERIHLKKMQTDFLLLSENLNTISGDHVVGGAGYIHSLPNYVRVLQDGMSSYRLRIVEMADSAETSGDTNTYDFEIGLMDVLLGIEAWHKRIVAALTEWRASDAKAAARRDTLLNTYRRVPWKPANTFREAIVCYNLVFYLDYCDNPGRIDQILYPYYEKDKIRGDIDKSVVRSYLEEFTNICCLNDSWSAAIGGTRPDGLPAYNDITELCLQTVVGHHRPNYQLRIRRDMPEAVWNETIATLTSGCGQPALYNEEGYYRALAAAEPSLTKEDLSWWNGGGCTETMIQGLSNVGSLDSGINLLLILEKTLARTLPSAQNFRLVVEAFIKDSSEQIRSITEQLNAMFLARAALAPHPIRSLLIDDCIDSGRDFQAGGARYNWSVNNVAGLSNVVDSLMAVKQVVFDNGAVDGKQLLHAMAENYAGDESLRKQLMACPRFGNDNREADDLAVELARSIFGAYREKKTLRGGTFLPSCIMFTTYGSAGAAVGATPDGRYSADPVADSMGPAYGRDLNGPTAMLTSVTKLPLGLAAGTPVVNIRIKKDLLLTPEGRNRFRDLIQTYFAMGGLQIQVNVFDQDSLKNAIARPEEYEDLIIRIGGYSVRFNSLSSELKQSMLERTEHAV